MSKVKVMMGIIEKCGVRGDATICIVYVCRRTSEDLSVFVVILIFILSFLFFSTVDFLQRCFRKVNGTRSRDRVWPLNFTMLHNRKNLYILCVEIRISLSEDNFNKE